MNSRLKEINQVINELMPNNNNNIDIIKEKYNLELKDYKYIDNVIDFSLLNTQGSIKYINKYDLKLRYGGLLIKIYSKNEKWYGIIKKINNKRYNVSFNNNYIFYCETRANLLSEWGKYFLSELELGIIKVY